MVSRTSNTRSDRRGGVVRSADSYDRVKRIATIVLGGVLFFRGLKRRSARGMAMALVGGTLLIRALRSARTQDGAGDPRPSRSATGSESTGAADEPTISRSITIGKPADELYDAWRDPDVFSRVMGHVAEVESSEDGHYVWTVDGPLGGLLSWETRIVEDEPGEFVRWRTSEDSTVQNEGSVRFSPAPGDRGTEVTLRVRFDPPGGRVGSATLERLDVVPEALAGRALDRFKSLVETGAIPTKEGNPSGRGKGDLL